ncbi:MAG: ring-cleaving dioxygenase [Balneolaceae bacterium]|nr:ring-cleaving dioxygenase [Balneolaceae bacterium]MCH8548965.1 ring-cleaving dioxygenase [Balneolaceae bacterium]
MKGIHHISIIAGNPQVNAEFYVKTLGLRLVLKTVNQDDPSTYHLFYANGAGAPGSSITFFPWPLATPAQYGTGETTSVSFSIPEGSAGYWKERFDDLEIGYKPGTLFGRKIIRFRDPDGLPLTLVEDSRAQNVEGWKDSTVPEEHSIRGFWGATFTLSETESTVRILTEVLGFTKTDEQGDLTLLTTDAPIGQSIVLMKSDTFMPGRSGKGTVHHVAFRTRDEAELEEFREIIEEMGLHPTGIIDRHVFKSVYYKTPGGVLFEMATDGPGYLSVAEDESELGEKLFLPPWLEKDRDRIEQNLQPIEV